MTNLALFIAKRYLFSKKTINAINIISGISVLGVLVSTAALVSILSFYNGMEKLIWEQYDAAVSDIRIQPKLGKKIYNLDTALLTALKNDPKVLNYYEVLEENALFQRKDQQIVATLKGVPVDYLDAKLEDSILFNSSFVLEEYGIPYAIVGANVDYSLNIPFQRDISDIAVYMPKRHVTNSINPAEEFNVMQIQVSGMMGNHEVLNNLVIVPITFVRELVEEENAISAIEINLKPQVSITKFAKEWNAKLGEDFVLLSPEQQNSSLYKIIKSEKWAIFAILTLTGFIAILNIIASLTMLVLDKRKDIAVLNGIGASKTLIRRIFFYQGMLISLAGCIIGLLIGFLLAWTQQEFGWLRFSNSENLFVESYPVDIRATDFLLVFITVFVVSYFISNLSSRLSLKQNVRLS